MKAKERNIKTFGSLLIFGLILYSFYLLDKRPEVISMEKAYLALGVAWLGFLPSIQYLLDYNRPPMPFFPLIGIFYAIGFGLPIFATETEIVSRFALSNVTDEALMLTLLGLAGMNIAFFTSKSTIWKKVAPIRLSQTYSIRKILNLSWLLLFLSFAFQYIPFLRSLPSINMLFGGFIYICYGMFFILWSRGKLPKIQTWLLLFICIPIEIIPRLTSGLLANVMILFLFMFNIIWYELKTIPVIFLAILVVFYLAFSPVKSEYRYLHKEQLNEIEKAQAFINLVVEYHQKHTFNNSSTESFSKKSSNEESVTRFALITLLSDVMKKSPEIVPYWNGETYLPLFTSFIPRIFWPGKPEIRVGNDFGHRYKILDANDFNTSINLPILVEMYVNFGNTGLMLGMPLLGCVLALIDTKMNNPRMNELEFVVGASTIFGLIYQEGNASTLFGTVIPFSIAMCKLIEFYLSTKKSPV
jgi:hypothetical protein